MTTGDVLRKVAMATFTPLRKEDRRYALAGVESEDALIHWAEDGTTAFIIDGDTVAVIDSSDQATFTLVHLP